MAKAETSASAVEAEALTTAAQELVSRHVSRLLLDDPSRRTDEPILDCRQMWIDGPYVSAQGAVISAVASANRCHLAFSEDSPMVLVFGEAPETEFVEMLAASLMRRAKSAMLRHGSQFDSAGTSRTRSFRHSFLVAFAHRAGERLRQADRAAVQATGQRERVLAMRRASNKKVVSRLLDLMSPQARPAVQPKPSDPSGWSAGEAAADPARLGSGVRHGNTG